ncbi:tetratricopeptide repeat protein 12 [Stigmatopora argus]
MDSIEDLDVFLKNIDDISNLVKELNSSDVKVQQKALQKADSKIAALNGPCRTKINKTTINTKPASNGAPNEQAGSAENFMRFMEKDAEDRRKRRLAQEKKATVFKDEGNRAYGQGDYETAVKYYSSGLGELRDMQQLYTNRAQAYIKLGRCEDAISDCEWALKCNDKCIKAYVHMGKAYLGLKQYSASRMCFEKMAELDPQMEKMAKEYLCKIELEEKREHEEFNARQDFDKGVQKAKLIPQLLDKLSEPGQMLLYYCGILEILCQVVTDCSGQTLFRLHDGFGIIDGNDTTRSCLLQEANDSCSQDLCALVLNIWTTTCRENEENQKTLLSFPVSKESLVPLVSSQNDTVQKECLELLTLYSLTSHGRCLLVDNLDVCRLMRSLMECISAPRQQRENRALLILQKLAEDKNFIKRDMKGQLGLLNTAGNKWTCRPLPRGDQFLPAFSSELYGTKVSGVKIEHFVSRDNNGDGYVGLFRRMLRTTTTDSVAEPFAGIMSNISKDKRHVVPPLLSVFGSLIADDVIRRDLARHGGTWKALLIATKQCIACSDADILFPLLGLLINLSTLTSPVIQEYAITLCDCCLQLLKEDDVGVVTRAMGVLSAVLSQSSEAVNHVVQRDAVKTVQRLLKRADLASAKYAVKILTSCTAASQFAREELVKSDKKLSVLQRWIGSSRDEVVSGNAALCLAHCLELKGVASDLLGTDIVMLLLRHAAGDAKKTAVQQNSAIALGKLCQSEPRHVSRLRELHGFEILHSCMKLIK